MKYPWEVDVNVLLIFLLINLSDNTHDIIDNVNAAKNQKYP